MRGFIDTLNFVGTIAINDTVAASMTTSERERNIRTGHIILRTNIQRLQNLLQQRCCFLLEF